MGAVVPITLDPSFERPSDLPHTCSDENLVLAVQEWLIGASDAELAGLLRVTKDQVRNWTKARGWDKVAVMLRDDLRSLTHAHQTRLVNKTFKLLNDRLDNGDPIVDERGKVTGYRPLRAKDLALIQAQVLDRQEVIEKRLGLNPDEGKKISLEELHRRLERYADEHILPAMTKRRVIDGTAAEAVDGPPAGGDRPAPPGDGVEHAAEQVG